jgi:hypothetical protein
MERRRAHRRLVARDEALCRAKLRTGGELRVLDASSWGALAETTERLLPGRHLDVHVVSSQGRILVRARVARAWVSRLEANVIHYRAALAFECAVDVRVEGYPMPAPVLAVQIEPGNAYPDRVGSGDIEFTERLST